MIDLKIKSFQAGFFDRKAVADRLGRVEAKVLGEFGRLVRKRAQGSLKYASGSSPPGRPPNAHRSGTATRTSRSTGRSRTRRVSYLREFLWYAFDRWTRTVVVGPAKLNGVVDRNALPALEEGGISSALDFEGNRRRIRVRKRPFMGPALAAEKPKLPALWRDTVR